MYKAILTNNSTVVCGVRGRLQPGKGCKSGKMRKTYFCCAPLIDRDINNTVGTNSVKLKRKLQR